MRLTVGLMLAYAVACVSAAFALPEIVGLERRQVPGTPQYDCHLNCGAVITLSRAPNYCTSTNFTSSLTSCLNCAVGFNIWTIYGGSVSTAARACGLAANPVGLNSTTTANSTTSALVGSASVTSTVRTGSTSGAVSTTLSGTVSGSGTASGSAATATRTGAASRINVDHGLTFVLIGLFLA